MNEVLVSSDSPEVLAIARNYQGVGIVERPAEIAGDTSPAIDYQCHSLAFMKQTRGKTFDCVAIIQPSSPLRTGRDIDGTVDLLRRNPQADSAVSVVSLPHMVHPSKLKKMEGNRLLPLFGEEETKTSAHELPPVFVRNCAVYVFKVSNIVKNVQFGQCSLGFVMPPETAVDINTELDFEFAEYLFQKGATS